MNKFSLILFFSYFYLLMFVNFLFLYFFVWALYYIDKDTILRRLEQFRNVNKIMKLNL